MRMWRLCLEAKICLVVLGTKRYATNVKYVGKFVSIREYDFFVIVCICLSLGGFMRIDLVIVIHIINTEFWLALPIDMH